MFCFPFLLREKWSTRSDDRVDFVQIICVFISIFSVCLLKINLFSVNCQFFIFRVSACHSCVALLALPTRIRWRWPFPWYGRQITYNLTSWRATTFEDVRFGSWRCDHCEWHVLSEGLAENSRALVAATAHVCLFRHPRLAQHFYDFMFIEAFRARHVVGRCSVDQSLLLHV